MNKNEIIELLKQNQSTLNNRQYAEFLGISENLLYQIYAGRRSIGMESLASIAQAFSDTSALSRLLSAVCGFPIEVLRKN